MVFLNNCKDLKSTMLTAGRHISWNFLAVNHGTVDKIACTALQQQFAYWFFAWAACGVGQMAGHVTSVRRLFYVCPAFVHRENINAIWPRFADRAYLPSHRIAQRSLRPTSDAPAFRFIVPYDTAERRFANKCEPLSGRQLRQQAALSYLWFPTDGCRIDQLGGLCMHRGCRLRPTTSIIH